MNEHNALAERHLGLVHSLCKRFAGKGVEYEELYAAGCLGLVKALNRFDESRELQFSTYAFPVILGEIKRLFRDGGAVKVSRSLKELSLKISRLNNESLQTNGVELSVNVLAEQLNVSPERIAEAIACAQTPLSLTASTNDEDGAQLDIPTPDIQYAVTEHLTLHQALRSLDERDRALIRLRYYQGKTQTETAGLLDMTQVQVSRREKKLLGILRREMSA